MVYRKILLFVMIVGLISILIPDDIISQNDHHDLGSQIIDHDNTLRLLTWNIKMFPPPYGWLHDRSDRAKNIILSIKKSIQYDIILFQEAFSSGIRDMIYSELKSLYPYQLEPNDPTRFYQINSGLWAISSVPIELIKKINFKELRETDVLASKGAYLYLIEKDNQKFKIINTHMQADYETKYNDIRIQQYQEINDHLIVPFEQSDVPIILCGDLNIFNQSRLSALLDKLKLKNGPLDGNVKQSIIYSATKIVDYILHHQKDDKFRSIHRKIRDMSKGIKANRPNDLSDHYPVEAIFKW